MRQSFILSSHHPVPALLLAILVSAFLLQWPVPALAQSSTAEREMEEASILLKRNNLRRISDPVDKTQSSATIQVYDDKWSDLQGIPGSAHEIKSTDIERFHYSDIHQLLRQVPGLNIREEGAYGLRPNIGTRGSIPERSQGITLLEDGVLIAPAPYAAPAAYYFPTAGRMSGIEVMKGPDAITQGPHTGGTLNLLSTPIPKEQGWAVKNELGGQGIWRMHAWYGASEGPWSGLIETHQHGADGFKDIDLTPDDTGFDRQDYLVKLRYSWNTSKPQQSPQQSPQQFLQLKLQHSQEDSDQSDLGLTNADFRDDPDRRYAPSQLDNFDAEHDQLMLRWSGARHEPDLKWNLTAYRNDFEHKWYKTEGYYTHTPNGNNGLNLKSWSYLIDKLNGSSEQSQEYRDVLDGGDTTTNKYIGLRGHNRKYFSQGVQFRVQWQIKTGTVVHLLQAGVRQHRDEEDRFHPEYLYAMKDGQLVENETLRHLNANRIQSAEATAIWVSGDIVMKKWVLSPGLRYEKIRQRSEDWGDNEGDLPSQSEARAETPNVHPKRTDVLLPGLGITRLINNQKMVVFFGVHEGFAPPNNSPEAKEESSLNYELGARLGNESDGELNLTVFYNDYRRLLGYCTESIGAACNPGDIIDLGEAAIKGLEVDGRIPLPHGLQAEFNLTYTDAEFKSNIGATDLFGEVEDGDPLPYTPRRQGQVNLSWEGAVQGKESNLQLAVTYVENTCVTPRCDERTDSLFSVDFKASVDVYTGLQLYAKATNLFDKRTIVARQPHGVRPNQPRTLLLGVHFDF